MKERSPRSWLLIVMVNFFALNTKYMPFHGAELGLSFHFHYRRRLCQVSMDETALVQHIKLISQISGILNHVETKHKVFLKNGTYCLLYRMYLKDKITLF